MFYSSSSSLPRNGFSCLPKSIEEATRRYLYLYEQNFIGQAAEMYRLKNLAQAFILQLRKLAPKFYEEKLPTLLNQAGSTLLTCNTSNSEGLAKFHNTHRYLLKMLKELQETQPANEVSFYNERKRIEEQEKLGKRQRKLTKRLEELEATEFNYDDLGEEDSNYAQVIKETEELRNELKRVAIEIAFLHGETIDEEPQFELKVPPRSSLAYLTKEQLKNLEQQMLQFYKDNNKKKNALYEKSVDKSVIDPMIEKLNIDMTQFKKEEIKDIAKDALDAYKTFFREIDIARREEFHQSLLKNRRLRPKEGKIFKDPDDVPEEMRLELDNNSRIFERQMEQVLEDYKKRPSEAFPDDELEELDEPDDFAAVMETIKEKGLHFARVKEEPREDLSTDESESEQQQDQERNVNTGDEIMDDDDDCVEIIE